MKRANKGDKDEDVVSEEEPPPPRVEEGRDLLAEWNVQDGTLAEPLRYFNGLL